GRNLFIVTSKTADFARGVAEHFGIARYCRALDGRDLGGRPEHKATLLGQFLHVHAVPAGDTVMIGDRADDVIAARANGVRTIGALWGYGSERELIEAGADTVCATPAELLG